MGRRLLVGLTILGILAALPGSALALGAPSRSSGTDGVPGAAAPDPTPKLRADLAALVAGTVVPDPRIAGLVPNLVAGELAFFAVLDGPLDAGRRATIESLGARFLRTYRTVDAVALGGSPVTVLGVAALAWTRWLAPVEVVVALAEPAVDPLPDQARGGPADVGATEQWANGITGTGVRIAVLDTGHDPLHPDLDDLDFRRWSTVLPPASPKLVDARNFNEGGCAPFAGDGHGHGTHVAAIATGTAEGGPAGDDDGRYPGMAPGAELAVGKVLTDAGAGVNSDLIAALEWAAMPAESGPTGCAIGADVVNLSLGSEARPTRLNSGQDADLVSLVVNRLAVRYGTLIVAAAGNSGPYIGSVLETPGSAAQALSVGATAKDWDLNHDDTLSGDTCAGYRHPRSPSAADNDCRGGIGTQGPSVAAFSSRGPSGDLWLRPDLVAPGYAIVSAQSSSGTALAGNDLNLGTRTDPFYATASGTSMAAPTTAGSAALVLEAYRDAHGVDPSGGSGLAGLRAPTHALLRAALMNTAGGGLEEARWILTTDAATRLTCPRDVLDPLDPTYCIFADLISGAIADSLGSLTLYEVRNGARDPQVGPLAEGAGKLNIGRAIGAIRDGLVLYSAASGTGADAGTGPRDFQGSWQVGSIAAGATNSQPFVVHAAPGVPATAVAFAFEGGAPSDGSRAIPSTWSVSLPATTTVPAGGDALVTFRLTVPADAAPGVYTGAVLARTGTGTTLRIPVFVAVGIHDPDPAPANPPGPQAVIASERDVYAKDDTLWPSGAGAAAGATADWRVYPVDLGAGLGEARFAVVDAAAGDETYDLYVYDARLDLLASTHPFLAPGVSDLPAQRDRGPSTAADPTTLVLPAPAAGRHYVVVNRARIGRGPLDVGGDMGAFRLTLDEVAASGPPRATAIAYEGDHVFRQGTAGRLAARLTASDGSPIAGRALRFTFDAGTAPCPGGSCVATTGPDGLAQVATEPIALAAGIHDVQVRFAGDAAWSPARVDALAIVIGTSPPPIGGAGGGQAQGGAWFVPNGSTAGPGDTGRIHVGLDVRTALPAPTGDLRWTDRVGGLDLRLDAWTSLVVDRDTRAATATGRARTATGSTVSFELTVRDAGEPGRDRDTIRLRLLDGSYDRSGTLGGGNLQVR
ncbi:MAG TPA: S8 family serine peptidase [Patescibacteria group bacterium]|nr:S8 family serine peptidase [Patescibacteria group bacterium]